MARRLAAALSPYLRQHADNPVDWWEWGPEAFAEARRLDIPILLSVGYAACHWCHVMAHESFEADDVAAALDGRFVAIKVDREERPDVDAIYMAATTALTGRGGWPMTVLLTPELTPFWAGTYLPKAQFLALLDAATQAWTSRREDVDRSASHILDAVTRAVSPQPAVPIDEGSLEHAVHALERTFDRRNGGFGHAPKFPPAMTLLFLLRHAERTGSARAMEMVTQTCEAMAYGGLYDQVGGGFARYAVDAGWVVPHFEKMLYDNALLAQLYVQWWRATGHPLGRRIAQETCEMLLRDFRTRDGGFASSLDADTVGVEGATYVWTPGELVEVLGDADGARAAEVLGVTAAGTFEHGSSTLRWTIGLPDPGEAQWWADVRARLAAARAARPQPARDDKVVASWNGLALTALAQVGSLLEEPRYITAAVEAAQWLMSGHLVDGRLRRVSREGVVGEARAVADDYGNVASGCIHLFAATGDAAWLTPAGDLLQAAAELFGDGDGVFFDTEAETDLVTRVHSASDNAEPSGQSAIAAALVEYAVLTGSADSLELADAALAVGGGLATHDPRFAGWTLAAAEARVAGPVSVVVIRSSPDEGAELLRSARQAAPSGALVVAARPDQDGVPVATDRGLVGGRPAAYICRGTVCSAPVTDPERMSALLRGDAHSMPWDHQE
ncbi:MAG: thioredoxin domain-containing protein [Dermatophilaceae bacterium]